MAQPVLLNNVDHKDLRIDTGRGAALGDDVMFAPTFAAEFRNVQAHYPIVFRKAADGSFQAIALFGFHEKQNLFLDGERWDATYLPLAIERQPFLIGIADAQPVIHVDLDSPRIAVVGGEPVFRAHGGTTEFLERMSSVLLTLHQGLQAMPAFVAALLRHDLLESFVLDIELDDGAQHRLAGFYTINEERLRGLDGDAVARLHADGHLEPVFMAIASLSKLRSLIERTNRQHAADR